MILDILKGAPFCVYILFGFLFHKGVAQSKDRYVTKYKAMLMPFVFTSLSFLSMVSILGGSIVTISFWVLGVLAIINFGTFLYPSKTTKYLAEKKEYYIQGSWRPLFYIMLIFFTKFTFNIAIATHNLVLSNHLLIHASSFLFGALAGIFASRTLMLLKINIKTKKVFSK